MNMTNELYSNLFLELENAYEKGLLDKQYFIDNYENIIKNTNLTKHISYILMWMNEIDYNNANVYRLFLRGSKKQHQKGACVSRVLIFAPAHERMVREIFLETYHSGKEDFPFSIEDVLRDVNKVRINIFDVINNGEQYDYSARILFRTLDAYNLFLVTYSPSTEYTINDLYAELPKELQLGVLI